MVGEGLRAEPKVLNRGTVNERVLEQVAAFDVTFSPAKSLSVLWATATDRHVRDTVVGAHETAVSAGLAYLEANAGHTRVGRLYGIWNLLIWHRLSDLRSQADDGTAAAKIATGLLADVQTRVVFRQAPDQVDDARQLLHLTDVETTLITRLVKGRALWLVANRATVVQHVIGSQFERQLVDTDSAMSV